MGEVCGDEGWCRRETNTGRSGDVGAGCEGERAGGGRVIWLVVQGGTAVVLETRTQRLRHVDRRCVGDGDSGWYG